MPAHRRPASLNGPIAAIATCTVALAPAVVRAQTVIDFFDTGDYPGLEAFVEDQAGYADNAPATPDITADFDGLQLWDTGYGDLTKIAYVDSGAGASRPPLGVASITLTAAAGALVQLDSVDLAGFGGGLDFDSITVTGGDIAFAEANVPAPGAGHNTLDFGGITGQQLVITFNDADSQESAGLDNLRFAQVIPEPAGITAGAATLGLIAALPRRRRRI